MSATQKTSARYDKWAVLLFYVLLILVGKMEQRNTLHPRPKIIFCSTKASKERCATDIGNLNSPYPAKITSTSIYDGSSDVDFQMPVVKEYETPGKLQLHASVVHVCQKRFASGHIVGKRSTNHGLEYKIRWEEAWVPEQELLQNGSQAQMDMNGHGPSFVNI